MYRRDQFAPGEWYHVYNRGIDKRVIFADEYDFQRFKKLLYLANNVSEVNLETYKETPYAEIFNLPRNNPLVSIGAYCLMGNHPHLLLQEKTEGGIVSFMRKLGTGYTMYFNRKYDRIGNLMVKPFRSKRIHDDAYLRWVTQYIHLNPAELFEPGWKYGDVRNISRLEKSLLTYRHSSLPEYFNNAARPERAIIDDEAFELLSDDLPPLKKVLETAQAYYEEVSRSFELQSRGRPKKGATFY